MPYMDIPTGFTGFTVDVFEGSVSDSEGDVTKVLFAITFQERLSDVKFSITTGTDHWSAMTPTGEYIGLRNPKVLGVNCIKSETETGGIRKYTDSAVVIFDMDEKYPSNSLMTLCARNPAATYNVVPIDAENGFSPYTGAIGFTSNEYGGSTNDEGEVERVVFNIAFSNRRNEIEFELSDDDEDWAALMPDGSTICLKNPNVLFQNRDGATIVFQMYDPAQKNLPLVEQWCGYPSNAPALLVRRREQAKWTITEIDEDHPFIPIQNIVFPDYIPVGERVNLHTQVVVYPMNSTIRGIEWSIKSASATEAQVSNGWITTVNPGKIVLGARIPNGLGVGQDFFQDVEVYVIENWITINEHPHLDNAIIAGQIKEEIAVLAETEFGDLTYQWYKAPNKSNETGTAISGATEPIFKIPKNLVPGNYYYFCEVRKVNFPSIRTNCAYVRVRDNLRSLSIYPSSASIPPGAQQQFAVDKNPKTCDEALPVIWNTSDSSIIDIDENGLATSYNPGVVTLSARVENVTTSIIVRAVYTPVNAINFDMDTNLEAGKEYTLPTMVTPADASFRDIIWEVVNGGTTGAVIANGVLSVRNEGKLTIRGTITNGLNPTTNFSQEFSMEVAKAYIPVNDISLNNVGTPRAGQVVPLKGTIVPANSSASVIQWSLGSVGNTRAKLVAGNLLSVENPGVVQVIATVANGISLKTNFQKTYSIEFKSAFVPVQGIDGLPDRCNYFDGTLDNGVKLNGTVVPANAENTKIQYRISSEDESDLNPSMLNNTLYFDSTGMTDEDRKSIKIDAYVVNGLGDGVNYITTFAIFVDPPAAATVFVPIQKANWELPSILRAYRPIIIDRTTIVPFDASRRNMIWDIARNGVDDGCSALTFLPTPENHQDLLDNGVLFTDEYDWDFKGNYIYPMSGGKLDVTLTVMDGLEVGTNFTEKKTLTIKDPFIKVRGLNNVPSAVYAGSTYYLSPEIDTGDGMDEQTAIWDDRVATYQTIQYKVLSGPATVDGNGNLSVKAPGIITMLMTIPSGLREAYEWHGHKFDQVDFTKKFIITAKDAEKIDSKKSPVKLTLKLTNGKTVKVYRTADYDKLRAIRPANAQLSIGDTTFARQDVAEITFESKFEYTDLSNFGRNMTNLVKINKIPDSARNLRNFLMGCTKFNQFISIPSGITGARCLEGFLRGCTSFNKPVYIPKVNGDKCLESFLRGCTAFNQNITLPSEIRGNYAMYSFLQGCKNFNATITLPKKIYGIRCMENVLRDCVKFNRQITLPEDISGKYNFAAFMFNCDSFTKEVIVPTERFGEMVRNDVITMATFHRGSAMDTAGINIYGPGAAKFQETVGDQGSATLIPLRTLKLNGQTEIPEPEVPEDDGYIGVMLDAMAMQNSEHNEYAVGDDVNIAIDLVNSSEKLKLTNMALETLIPSATKLTAITSDKDVTIVKTYEDDTTSEVTITAPKPEHVHSFEGNFFYDADGHWQKCSGCDVLSEKHAHTSSGDATETEDSVCTVCGYVLAHRTDGVNAGDPNCEHNNTELRNVIEATEETEGYSGDLYCVDCDCLIAVGHVVPKITSEPAALSAEDVGGVHNIGDDEPVIKSIKVKVGDMEVGDAVNIMLKTAAEAAGDVEFNVTANYSEINKADENGNVASVSVNILEAHAGSGFTVTYSDGMGNTLKEFTDLEDGADIPEYDGDEPTREGFTFGGWSCDVEDATTVTEDLTFTAIWNPVE